MTEVTYVGRLVAFISSKQYFLYLHSKIAIFLWRASRRRLLPIKHRPIIWTYECDAPWNLHRNTGHLCGETTRYAFAAQRGQKCAALKNSSLVTLSNQLNHTLTVEIWWFSNRWTSLYWGDTGDWTNWLTLTKFDFGTSYFHHIDSSRVRKYCSGFPTVPVLTASSLIVAMWLWLLKSSLLV